MAKMPKSPNRKVRAELESVGDLLKGLRNDLRRALLEAEGMLALRAAAQAAPKRKLRREARDLASACAFKKQGCDSRKQKGQ